MKIRKKGTESVAKIVSKYAVKVKAKDEIGFDYFEIPVKVYRDFIKDLEKLVREQRGVERNLFIRENLMRILNVRVRKTESEEAKNELRKLKLWAITYLTLLKIGRFGIEVPNKKKWIKIDREFKTKEYAIAWGKWNYREMGIFRVTNLLDTR